MNPVLPPPPRGIYSGTCNPTQEIQKFKANICHMRQCLKTNFKKVIIIDVGCALKKIVYSLMVTLEFSAVLLPQTSQLKWRDNRCVSHRNHQ